MRQKLPQKKSYDGAKKHKNTFNRREVVGGDRKSVFSGPRRSSQASIETHNQCYYAVVELLLYYNYLLYYFMTTLMGVELPQWIETVVVRPYGSPLRRSIHFARKCRVVAALAHVARHVANG